MRSAGEIRSRRSSTAATGLLAGLQAALWMVVCAGVAIPHDTAAQVPAVGKEAALTAEIARLIAAGQTERAIRIALRYAAPDADTSSISSELRRAADLVGQRAGAAVELTYRAGPYTFARLVSPDSARLQLGIEFGDEPLRLKALVDIAPWLEPAERPMVLGAMLIGSHFEDGVPHELAGIGAGLGLYSAQMHARLQASGIVWDAPQRNGHIVQRLGTDPPGAVLLFVGVAGLRPGIVQTVPEEISLSGERTSVTFRVAGREYEVSLAASNPDLCDAVIVLTSGRSRQVLYQVTPGECDEPHFAIEWAGDLDGDGRLDLVVAFSGKYSVFPLEVYLSSIATEEELVGRAASYVHTGR